MSIPSGETRFKQFDRVAGEAERAIDDDVSRLRVERGQHFREHDRLVLARGGRAANPLPPERPFLFGGFVGHEGIVRPPRDLMAGGRSPESMPVAPRGGDSLGGAVNALLRKTMSKPLG